MLVAALLLGTSSADNAGSPLPQAEMCVLLEQSITKLGHDVGSPEAVAAAAEAAPSASMPAVAVRQRGLRFSGPWGRCRIRLAPGAVATTVEEVRVDRDGLTAMVAGGWIAGPLLGSGGECWFRKGATGWQLVGCLNTWAV